MSDDLHRGFDEAPEEEGPAIAVPEEEKLDIAWGFVALLVFAALVTVFIVQNSEPTRVEVLWTNFEMSLGLLIIIVVLVTVVFDQAISFLYRQRKRKARKLARQSGSKGADGE